MPESLETFEDQIGAYVEAHGGEIVEHDRAQKWMLALVSFGGRKLSCQITYVTSKKPVEIFVVLGAAPEDIDDFMAALEKAELSDALWRRLDCSHDANVTLLIYEVPIPSAAIGEALDIWRNRVLDHIAELSRAIHLFRGAPPEYLDQYRNSGTLH